MWDEYVIYPEESKSVQIDIFRKISNGNKVHGKIAPGSYGSFVIKLIKPQEAIVEIQVKDITTKPKNLVFFLEGQEFYSMEAMQKELQEKFLTKEKVKIDWKWKYETSTEGDIEDTQSGKNAQSYLFEVKAIIEE